MESQGECNIKTEVFEEVNIKLEDCDVKGFQGSHVYKAEDFEKKEIKLEEEFGPVGIDDCKVQVDLTEPQPSIEQFKPVFLTSIKGFNVSQVYQGLQCTFCTFVTKDIWVLRQHARAHYTDQTELACSHCEYTTVQKTGLDRHFTEHHAAEIGYRCTVCRFTTPYKRKLVAHIKTHEDDHAKQMLCSYSECYYRTGHERNLKRHILKTHS